MPVVKEQLLFTILDMTLGYYEIPIGDDCKKYTAFLTLEGWTHGFSRNDDLDNTKVAT